MLLQSDGGTSNSEDDSDAQRRQTQRCGIKRRAGGGNRVVATKLPLTHDQEESDSSSSSAQQQRRPTAMTETVVPRDEARSSMQFMSLNGANTASSPSSFQSASPNAAPRPFVISPATTNSLSPEHQASVVSFEELLQRRQAREQQKD